jgi:outer membrane receptor protein involved in Fe transport
MAESVVVPADRAPVWRDAAAGTTVLGREDLQRVPALTLDEAARVVSGFSLFRRSSARQANPTTHGVTMRGLSASGASRGLVLMDGIPLNDGFGGWVTWTRVPPLAIDRVDLTRGAAGDVFGSDAVGGVIRVVPETGRVALWSARAQAGSTGLGTLDAAAGGPFGGWTGYGAVGWLTTDGSIPVEPDARGDVDRPTDASWASGFGQASTVRGTRRFSISGWGGRDDRGNGTVLQRNTMSGGTVAASFDATGRETTFVARVATSPNQFDQTFSAVINNRNTEFIVSSQTTETLTTRGIVEVGRTLGRGHVLARGEISRASADFVDVRDEVTDRALRDDRESISVQAGFVPVAVVTLGAGVRHEWRAAPDAGDGRDSATVGHASAAWRLAPAWHARGSVATTHRWPTLNELVRGFQVGSVVTLANPDLRPEQAVAVDGALAWEGRRAQVSAGGFWTAVDDAIANVTIPSLTGIVRERQNAGDTRSKGVEIDAEVRPGRGVRVRLSTSFTSAHFVDSAEPVLDGNRLPQVPRASFALSADVPLPGSLLASGVVRSVSAQFDDDRNTFALGPATQLDLRLAGRVGRFGWHIELENALDAAIEVGRTPLVTLAPPRAIRVGVSVR